MPSHDAAATQPDPAVSLRDALVFASQYAASADDSLVQALAGLDTADPEVEADALVASALTDLNNAIRQVRAFKQARAAGVAFDRPGVFSVAGQQLRELADLYTFYGVTTPEAFARRTSAEWSVPCEVTTVTGENERPGVRIAARLPGTDRVFSRQLFFPFTRTQWSMAASMVENEVTAALDPDVPVEMEAASEEADRPTLTVVS